VTVDYSSNQLGVESKQSNTTVLIKNLLQTINLLSSKMMFKAETNQITRIVVIQKGI